MSKNMFATVHEPLLFLLIIYWYVLNVTLDAFTKVCHYYHFQPSLTTKHSEPTSITSYYFFQSFIINSYHWRFLWLTAIIDHSGFDSGLSNGLERPVDTLIWFIQTTRYRPLSLTTRSYLPPIDCSHPFRHAETEVAMLRKLQSAGCSAAWCLT